jgi:Family of unknown function (DUF6516)
MLHEPLLRYLEEVEDAIKRCEDAFAELYEEEILAPDRVNLRIRLRFYNGFLLELNESLVFEGEVRHLGYRYHCQDNENNLVFRYDNTPHFPELKTFPHHKHLSEEVNAAERPSVVEVLQESRLLAR